MIVNVEVTKNSSENTMSAIRRFTKRVQGAGIIRHVRASRYRQRNPSKYIKRKKALKRIAKREEYEELFKLGKLPEKTKTTRRR